MYKRGKASLATRDNLDKYYTIAGTVDKCLSVLSFDDYDIVIEPSAGDGAFYNAIIHKNKVGIDIEPEHKHIIKQDWFAYEINNKYKNALVIGNPPFGRYHGLSSAFIKRALSFDNVQTIAFILPNVYKKYTRQKILPYSWRIKDILDIGKNSFYFKGEVKHIPSSFFVFDKSKGRDLRDKSYEYMNKVDFYFSNKTDFDLFLFGAAPQRIITSPRPNNRGHYIKSKINVDILRERLLNIKWSGLSSASGGVYWLTQGEIVKHYYECYCL